MDRYGLDSLIILKVGNELEDYFDDLSKSIFFQYETIFELCEYLIQNYKDRLQDIFSEEEREVKEEQQELGSIKSYSSSNSIQDEKELKLLTTQFLKEIISKVSEIPIKNIKEKVPMDRYGLDSIIILKLGNELEEYFNNLPKSIFLNIKQ